MGSPLHRALRCLCSAFGWKYAVFWRLKHRTQLMLSWEDVYYDCDDNQEKRFTTITSNLQDVHSSHDPIGIAVAKMSSYVFCLGEGIIGQVANTGKHMWVSTENHAANRGALVGQNSEWQSQFSAGIKTIAVVAVVPYGVVQLGSLDEIAEDLKMVKHIRDVFFELQGYFDSQPSYALSSCIRSSCQSDITTTTWGSEVHQECLHHLDRSVDSDWKNSLPLTYSTSVKPGHHYENLSIPGSHQNEKLDIIYNKEGCENSILKFGKSGDLHVPSSGSVYVQQLSHEELRAIKDLKCEEQGFKFGDFSEASENRNALSANNICGTSNLCDSAQLAENSVMDMTYLPSETIDSTAFIDEGAIISMPELYNVQFHKDYTDALSMPFRFSAGYELYEALGPAFQKRDSHCEWNAVKNESVVTIEMPDGMGSSGLLTENSGSEHLLDAVVANFHKNEESRSETSYLKPELPLDSEMISETCMSDMGSISSASFSFDWGKLSSFSSSPSSSICYSKGFSSTSCSKGHENLDRPRELNKMQKKRARPGESCRPRPRDRQLIQDRIKELRELVPNGSKCSIDSLLERTIKHMVFMQSITKHVEKLNKCIGSKFVDKEPSFRGSNCHEQGSSWAVEVGSNLKVCPIIVENSNVNNQMLVEMLCDECSQFLEIAEAIRGLGLAVLKGVTENYGEKTWIRFVVEGQTNKNMHRMDILWSLMQLLQPKLKA